MSHRPNDNQIVSIGASMDVPPELSRHVDEIFKGVDELGILKSQVHCLLDDWLESQDGDGEIRLLDIGAGKGTYTHSLLRRHPRLSATLVEPYAPFAADIAERANADGLSTRQNIVRQDIRVIDATPVYDIAICFSVGELLGAVEEKIRQVAAFVRSGGVIAVDEATLKDDAGNDLDIVGVYSEHDFRRVINEAGFDVLGRVPVDTEEYRTWLRGTLPIIERNVERLQKEHTNDDQALAAFLECQSVDFLDEEEMTVDTSLYLLKARSPLGF